MTASNNTNFDQQGSDKSVSRIHREMTIEDIFSRFPQKAQKLAQEMSSFGLSCVGCHASTWETLEAGMYSHGFQDEDIERLINKLNAILDETQDPTTVTITQKAAQKYLSILEAESKQGWGVRFLEKPGGCNGIEFCLDYSKEAKADDEIFESHGIEIHIQKDLVGNFLGSELDYLDGLNGSGFKFSNPNVKSSCACGTSYGY